MRYIIAVCWFVGSLGLACAAQAEGFSTEDVVSLARKGFGEEVLLAAVERGGNTYDLDAKGILKLKEAKLPEKVIAAMLRKAPKLDPIPPVGSSDDEPPVIWRSSSSEKSVQPQAVWRTSSGQSVGQTQAMYRTIPASSVSTQTQEASTTAVQRASYTIPPAGEPRSRTSPAVERTSYVVEPSRTVVRSTSTYRPAHASSQYSSTVHRVYHPGYHYYNSGYYHPGYEYGHSYYGRGYYRPYGRIHYGYGNGYYGGNYYRGGSMHFGLGWGGGHHSYGGWGGGYHGYGGWGGGCF